MMPSSLVSRGFLISSRWKIGCCLSVSKNHLGHGFLADADLAEEFKKKLSPVGFRVREFHRDRKLCRRWLCASLPVEGLGP